MVGLIRFDTPLEVGLYGDAILCTIRFVVQ